MNSQNITDTNARLLRGLTKISDRAIEDKNIDETIDKAIEESMIKSGTLTKYYPYLNKSEVRIDKTNEKVLCKNTSLFAGDLYLFHTPNGEKSFCDNLKEPCVIPRGNIKCLVVDIDSGDSDYLLLTFYIEDEIVEINPASMGSFKILAIGGMAEYSLRFGLDGLKIVSKGEIKKEAVDTLGDEIPVDPDEGKEYTNGVLTF